MYNIPIIKPTTETTRKVVIAIVIAYKCPTIQSDLNMYWQSIVNFGPTSTPPTINIYTLPGATAITNYGIANGGRQVNDYQQINIGSSPIRYKLGQSVNAKYFFFTTSTGRVPPQFPSSSAPNTHNLSLATNMSRLFIGNSGGVNQMNSHIARFTYYPIQITNQQLINLVS